MKYDGAFITAGVLDTYNDTRGKNAPMTKIFLPFRAFQPLFRLPTSVTSVTSCQVGKTKISESMNLRSKWYSTSRSVPSGSMKKEFKHVWVLASQRQKRRAHSTIRFIAVLANLVTSHLTRRQERWCLLITQAILTVYKI